MLLLVKSLGRNNFHFTPEARKMSPWNPHTRLLLCHHSHALHVGPAVHTNNTRSLALSQTPLPKSSVNPNNPIEVVGAVSGELDRVQALVNKEV